MVIIVGCIQRHRGRVTLIGVAQNIQFRQYNTMEGNRVQKSKLVTL